MTQQSESTFAPTGLNGGTGDTRVSSSTALPATPIMLQSTAFQVTTQTTTSALGLASVVQVPPTFTGTVFYYLVGALNIPITCSNPPCGSLAAGEITLAINTSLGRATVAANVIDQSGGIANFSTPANSAGIPVTVNGGVVTFNATLDRANFPLSNGSFRCSDCTVANTPGFANQLSFSGTVNGAQATVTVSEVDATGSGSITATLQQTPASRDLAQVTNARDSNLVKQGWLTLQQGDNDRLTLQAQQAAVGVAQSNIAAQEAQIRILEQEKAYQRVVAPFDGVITQRNIDNGSLVTSGSTFMFTLMHPDVIRTQVFVPQDEAFGLGPGVDAVVRVPEIPDRTFPGKVTRIATALQPGSRTLLTEIDVPNPDGALNPGIYCTVELLIPRKTPSMIIPADAVVFDKNGLHVAVVENGTAHLKKITIARDFGTEVEVHSGVKPGDQVILNPMVNLADGSKVAVRNTTQTS